MVGLGGSEQGWGGWSEVVRQDTWEKLMPESDLKRVREVFWETRQHGKGQGLKEHGSFEKCR